MAIVEGDYPIHNPAATPVAHIKLTEFEGTEYINLLIDHQMDDVEVGGRKLGISMSPSRAMQFFAEGFVLASKLNEEWDTDDDDAP